jgi:23S rRNA pseudouridine1911/1915/1917 synthase
MPPPLDILFEDDNLLVVNKPAGLSTQAPRGIDSLEVRVRSYLQSVVNADMKFWECDPTGEAPAVYLGLPHRLDRPASGAIVLTKTKKAACKVSRQFELRRVRKVYWAAVEGTVKPAEGTWIDHLRKVTDEAYVEVVGEDQPGAQHAVLRYSSLGQTPYGSWLEIELETGRMHQIRVQAGARGCPILGDVQYGSRVEFGPQLEDIRLRSIALHARELAFVPPGAEEPVTFTAPLPEPWRALELSEI